MRKIKKINGFLVVKFNDREKREYGDHAELARVREKRCVYHGRAVSPTKEN